VQVNKLLAVKVLEKHAHPFRACISASQEELQTWRCSAIG
jgi:hypothetical protein